MGVHVNIDHDKFPRQGRFLNARVKVCFNYNLNVLLPGVIVRDDIEEPMETLILLDDGRYVRAVECQYSLAPR